MTPSSIIVYTAIVGDYDRSRPVLFPEKGVRYLCFSERDRPVASGWELVVRPELGRERASVASRRPKLNPSAFLPPHDFSIWHDANMDMLAMPSFLLDIILGDYGFAAFSHPNRHTIEAEASAVMILGKAPPLAVETQLEDYRSRGLLASNPPLRHGGVLFRRNTPEEEQFNQLWQTEFNAGSDRDQLSLPVALLSFPGLAGEPATGFGDWIFRARGHGDAAAGRVLVPHRAREILGRLGRGPVSGVEVGVWKGETSALLLRRNDLTLRMVDSWQPTAGLAASGDPLGRRSLQTFQAARTTCLKATAFAGSRATEMSMTSAKAVAALSQEQFQFVFVDAEHSFPAVWSDLSAWWPLVAPGGLLCGHDYDLSARNSWTKGVREAVDRFAARHNLPVDIGRDNTWFLHKP